MTLLTPSQLPRSAEAPAVIERSASLHRGRIELATFYRGVHQRAANAAGIADVDWKSITELREELALGFPKVARLVADFIDAYDRWYSIHEGLERISAARLSMEQQRALADAVMRRDETRRMLIAELQK